MTEVNHYRLDCQTDGYVYVWDTVEPTVCPNDAGHTINPPIVVVESVSANTVRAEEDSDGYFETSTIKMNIPTGSPGDVSEHDVSWPMAVTLWKTLLTPTNDMVGDQISVVAEPETTIGVLTAPATAGDTTISVNSTVTDNAKRGFLITIDDGVNKDVCDRCSAVDSVNGTITFQTALVNSFAAGTLVKISIYVLDKVDLVSTETIDIGNKGIKGKKLTSDMKLRIYYTNNSGTSKLLRWRIELYNDM